MDLKRKNSSCDFFFRKSGKEAFGGPEAGRAWNTYPGKHKERAVLLFSISGRCLCLYFREGLRADRNHWNRWSFLPFFPGISAGALCKKAGGSTKRLSAHAAALLYLHLFREDQEDRRLWNLACDIAVEQIISREKIPILETGGDAKKIREKVFHILGDRSDSAEKICRKLKEQAFPFHLKRTGGSLSF